ncbi:MAG: thioredoxin [Clostridia bacterium]|nr:thioredoxin [Clostridia bacterium]MBQ8447036.1 thioredoxin [Clostridia bacterium]
MVKYVNAAGLEELIASSSLPVFCDFWASWCGPCRMLAPVFEEISDRYEGEAVFVKIDIDEEDSEAAAIKYGISSIPNIIVFKDGKPVASNLGFVPEAVLDAFVKSHL